jgi:23S rRNA (uridine2552-2'-O)-methyltransferase
MAKRWYQEHQRDPWRRQARNSGYRARSAFKLKQIQERHNIIRPGDSVLDIGCHPGGWTQVALEEVGELGTVVGVDLRTTDPIDGASFLTGDVREEDMIARLSSENSYEGYNSVVSDISPSLTGRYDTDQAVSLELSAMALDVAAKLLNPGGSFVTKAFQGTGIELLIGACKKRFSFVRRFSPTASRNASSEIYVVCKNKKPLSGRLESAIKHIHQGLVDAGVLVGDEEQQEEDDGPVVGFRRL